MEKTLSLSEVKAKLNQLVEDVDGKDDEVVITKNGRPMAVIVSASLYEAWKETQEIQSDPELLQEIRRGIARLKRKSKRYTFEEVFGEPLK